MTTPEQVREEFIQSAMDCAHGCNDRDMSEDNLRCYMVGAMSAEIAHLRTKLDRIETAGRV